MSIAEYDAELVYTTRSRVRSQRWRTWLLLLIFLGCGAAMGAGGVIMLRRDSGPPPLPPDRYVEMLRSSHFTLSDEQAERIREIVGAKRAEIEAIRAEFWPRLRAAFVATDDEVRAVLGPEQEAAYREWSAEMQERWMPKPGQGPPKWHGPGDRSHRGPRPRSNRLDDGRGRGEPSASSAGGDADPAADACCDVTDAAKSTTTNAVGDCDPETPPASNASPPMTAPPAGDEPAPPAGDRDLPASRPESAGAAAADPPPAG